MCFKVTWKATSAIAVFEFGLFYELVQASAGKRNGKQLGSIVRSGFCHFTRIICLTQPGWCFLSVFTEPEPLNQEKSGEKHLYPFHSSTG